MWTRTSWRTNRYESLDEIRIHGRPVICLCSARSQPSRCQIEGLFYLLSTHRKSYDTVEGLHAKFVCQDSILCPSSNQRWEDFIVSHRHFYLHIVLIRDGRKVRTIVRSRLDRISAFAWIKHFASLSLQYSRGTRTGDFIQLSRV